MELLLVQVDAFAERLFEGNPAAVMPLDAWLPDATLQSLAAENNLSETAFVLRENGAHGPGEAVRYALRWFTPAVEVDLCGHATLAAAGYLLDDVHPDADHVVFSTRSGPLTVARGERGRLVMDFPAEVLTEVPADDPTAFAAADALGVSPSDVVEVRRGTDLVVVLDSPASVEAVRPQLPAVRAIPTRGVVVTARTDPAAGSGWDFVSRWFGPQSGVDEDPVTGSAHCALAPYWAARLGRTRLVGRQVSSRGGTVLCTVTDARVLLEGAYRRYLTGTVVLDERWLPAVR